MFITEKVDIFLADQSYCYYKTYVIINTPTEWFDSHIVCQQAGMEMATVESFEEEERLEKELDKLCDLRSL